MNKFIKPKQHTATVKNVAMLNSKIVQITLDINNREMLDFVPGQYVSVKVAQDTFRAYSITASNIQKTAIQLLVEISHTGRGSDYMKNLKVGDVVSFVGPAGKFTLPNELAPHLVFVATSVGLAPFVPMLQTLEAQRYLGKIDLFLGIRTHNDLFKLDLLKYWENNFAHFNYFICFSQEQVSDTTQDTHHVRQGHVTEIITKSGTFNSKAQFLLCGNPKMILDMKNLLSPRGVTPEQIYSEEFYLGNK